MEDTKDRFAPGIAELGQMLHAISDKQLFFIGGSPKSGTTWLQLLLDKHPQIACAGETHFLDNFVPTVGKAISDHRTNADWVNEFVFADLNCCPSLDQDQLVTFMRFALALLLQPKTAGKRVELIGEKTPDNISNLPLMNRLFPKAKFIQMVRDGRDCAVSGWYHNRRLSASWAESHPINVYAITFAKSWSDHLDMGQAFAAKTPSLYHRVRYEDLSACPTETLRGVLDFLAVDIDDAILTTCLSAASFESLTGGRRRGQEDASSFFRKGETGDWRNYFDKCVEQAFNDIAGSWLKRLGYA